MSTETVHPYIMKDENVARGKPVVTGTRTRVVNIVAYYKLGYLPEELAREFPHLSLAQIYDVLSYYHENADIIDKEIENEKEENLISTHIQ
ncbi:MAG: DUF433 domain-containing protein [Bacteroidetes bacterium]|nr:DUF433 domain-containing protein [Bacteroidota bacterium]